MSNSALVSYVRLSPNNSGKRTQPISKITPHHMSGDLSVETCGAVFAPPSRKASSNYGIGSDARVGMYVEEDNRSWCSSSAYNDQRAVTIEVANSQCKAPWPVSDAAWNKLVDLCVDIVQRNPGIVRSDGKTPGLNYTGDKYGSLTKHKMFSSTDCPGSYLDQRMKALEEAVNAKLDGKPSSALASAPAATVPSAAKPPAKTSAPAAKASPTGPVAEFQKWLNATYKAWGVSLSVDDVYGPKTHKGAVIALQVELNKQFGSGLAVDGLFGEKTRSACINVRQGANGNITRVLQGMLYCKGYDPNGFDGSFGSGTAEALRKYQSAKGLTPDKVAGKNTWASLLG